MSHYIYLVAGVLVKWKNFENDELAQEYAKMVSEKRDSLDGSISPSKITVGVYRMIGSA